MSKARLLFFGKLTISFLVLFFLLRSLQLSKLATMLVSANWWFAATGVLLLAPNLLIQTIKWRYLLRLAHPHVSFVSAYQSLIVGYPLAFVTPGRLGEVGRAFYIREISQTRVLRLFVVDKLFNFVIILFAGLLGLTFLYRVEIGPNAIVYSAIIGVTYLAALILSTASPTMSRGLASFTRTHRLDRRSSAVLLTYSAFFYVIFISQFVFLTLAFAPAFISDLLQAGAATFLTKSLLPMAFGDLGIREGAAVLFCGKIGVAPAAAFNAAFSLFLINVAAPAILGLPTLMRRSAISNTGA